MSNHVRRMKLDTELSNILRSVVPVRLRRARAADLMQKLKPASKRHSSVEAIFKREQATLGKLTSRKERVERLLKVAKRVERKSQDRKWTR